MGMSVFTSLLLLTSVCLAEQLYQAACREPLGMNSGDIADHMVTASSSYDMASVGPNNARIRTETSGGAWCPGKQISTEANEWLQIDLEDYHQISLVESQGRFGNGQGQEYAEEFFLEYQREHHSPSDPWIRYRNRKGQEIFHANQNTYIAVLKDVNPPIIARKIRFIPYSDHPRTICMRVELYGCRWNSGVLSYSVRQGDRRGAEVDLYDFAYDGTVTDHVLAGGLGQLVDGERGTDNFRLDPTGTGKKGYEWIGWKTEMNNKIPVEMNFEFDAVRNFSDIRVYANNMFTKDVRVFHRAEVWFSIGGRFYQANPVQLNFTRDELMEYARWVIVPIPHRIAQYIKLTLYFDARWLIISEIQFNSVLSTSNVTGEVAMVAPSVGASTPPVFKAIAPILTNTSVPQSKETERIEENIGLIVTALVAAILLVSIVAVVVIFRQRRQKYGSGHRIKQCFEPERVTLNLHDLQLNSAVNPKLAHGNMYNSLASPGQTRNIFQEHSNLFVSEYPSEYAVIQSRKLPDVPPHGSHAEELLNAGNYTVPGTGSRKNTFIPNIYPDVTNGARSTPPTPATPDKGLLGVKYPTLQGVSGTNVYAVCDPRQMEELNRRRMDDLSAMEIPRENITFKEKIGEGKYGEVHLCSARQTPGAQPDPDRPWLVAVKTISMDADTNARDHFHREIHLVSRLKDPHIVCLLGVMSQEEPFGVVMEYMVHGDLNQYLRQHRLDSETHASTEQLKVLSYGSLIYMATQAASGMKYLESMCMVHRDVATRNCLVGPNFTIKISDLGMSQHVYSRDYYSIAGRTLLPIRWMSWESLLLGKFSPKSDVWSFGVTLWEILTFARSQPLDHLTDEDVLENFGQYYHTYSVQFELAQPSSCPKEIYDLMCECWNRDETHRPAFREIHMFLQRKNMGYDPEDDADNYNNQSRIHENRK